MSGSRCIYSLVVMIIFFVHCLWWRSIQEKLPSYISHFLAFAVSVCARSLKNICPYPMILFQLMLCACVYVRNLFSDHLQLSSSSGVNEAWYWMITRVVFILRTLRCAACSAWGHYYTVRNISYERTMLLKDGFAQWNVHSVVLVHFHDGCFQSWLVKETAWHYLRNFYNKIEFWKASISLSLARQICRAEACVLLLLSIVVMDVFPSYI